MSSAKKSRKWLVIWLGILQIFIGIGAVPSGIAMIADPSGSSLVDGSSLATHPVYHTWYCRVSIGIDVEKTSNWHQADIANFSNSRY